MSDAIEKLRGCAEYLNKKAPFIPKIGIVLGSGLGGAVDEIDVKTVINYSDIPSFPISTVAGHAGKFIFCVICGVPALVMQGRVHYYEGYEMTDVVLGVRLMKLCGAEKLILTNAAGGIGEKQSPGAFMAISGHISSFVPSPLRGENFDFLGSRFPDMSEVYDKAWRNRFVEKCTLAGIDMPCGVYLQCTGPNYETPEEIKMYARLGADAVGMSTAVEAMAGRHAGMSVLGISCITNKACGLSDKKLNHKEVQEVADKVKRNFKKAVEIAVECTND